MNINNAIIMAAGKGERLKPLTLSTPKPLIKVNGVPMIENIINSLLSVGIKDISVVVGYLQDKFKYLKNKYGVSLIINPDYDSANNISSLYYARHKLGGTIIMDGDQIITDINILKLDFKKSGYVCIRNEENHFSNEWILTLDEKSIISKCSRNGDVGGYILKSLSYWNKTDSSKLKKYTEEIYMHKSIKDIYWDDVPVFIKKEKFKLKGYVVEDNSILEIDSLDELKEIDRSYE